MHCTSCPDGTFTAQQGTRRILVPSNAPHVKLRQHTRPSHVVGVRARSFGESPPDTPTTVPTVQSFLTYLDPDTSQTWSQLKAVLPVVVGRGLGTMSGWAALLGRYEKHNSHCVHSLTLSNGSVCDWLVERMCLVGG